MQVEVESTPSPFFYFVILILTEIPAIVENFGKGSWYLDVINGFTLVWNYLVSVSQTEMIEK